ncbi:AMP-dependent synthetase/ligase [Variovorax sp. VNK109]|uniref:AMP-dependent synthetase/ligase n=1 Tax=Variovorax sp. VNK109 TaxID=3400919 RepID=UPI003C0FE2B2
MNMTEAKVMAETDSQAMGRHAVNGCETVPALFQKMVAERGSKVAMREKDLGIWQEITWQDYGDAARAVGLGMRSLGVQRGDVVSILSENIPEWLFADMGTQGIGAVTNGIYPTDSAKQIQYILSDSHTRVIFVEDEEQLDKVLEVRRDCPTLVAIVVFDMKGLRDFRDPMVMSFADLQETGRSHELSHTDLWAVEGAAARPDDIAVLIYTSGTTGAPKGSMISHRNLMYQTEHVTLFSELGEGDELLSFLPLCHIAERKFGILFSMKTGAVLNFVEGLDTVTQNIREVAPTFFFAVPRLWEKFYSEVTIRISEAPAICRHAYRTAVSVGERVADLRLARKPVPLHLAALHRVADLVVLRNIKTMLGIRRAKVLGTGAAPIAPALLRWYLALGFEMREIYGQTECTGIATIMPAEKRLGSVGKPLPGSSVKTSPEGELLVRGPHVFMGYLHNPEKTAETVVDGWLRTGDVGKIDDDGYVYITDRMKDIIITAGGKNITPSEIENLLKFSPYISDAVVIGDRRKFLTCLVMIDHDNVVKFAQDRNVPFSNYASLCHAKEVQDLIGSEIEKVNSQLARVETIKRFRLIDQLLTADDEELTPTMKLKRKLVNKKYEQLIESMYQD